MNKNIFLNQNYYFDKNRKIVKISGLSNKTKNQLFCSHKNFLNWTIISRLDLVPTSPQTTCHAIKNFWARLCRSPCTFMYFRQLRREFLSILKLLFHLIIFFHILTLHLIFPLTIVSCVAMLSNTVFRVASKKYVHVASLPRAFQHLYTYFPSRFIRK